MLMPEFSWVPIGFDIREDLDSIWCWDEARISTYLLTRKLKKPLSTDPSVWLRPHGSFDPPTPFGLLTDIPIPMAKYVIVRFGILRHGLSGQEETELNARLGLLDELPSSDKSAFQLLGFDVSDLSLLSGLMNCGYPSDSHAAIKDKWSPRLNRYHLFQQPMDAFDFRVFTNERVSEHSPFFVFSIEVLGL